MKRSVLLFQLILLTGMIYAQEDTLSWTPEFMMKIKGISSVTLSPDGEHLAYVIREPVMEGEKSEYLNHIWVARTDGSEAVQYTRGEKSCNSPKFSPDGKSLAFLTSRSDKNQVWKMRLMGGEAEQITDEKDGVQSFEWSPDGQSIAFMKKDADSEEEEKAKKEKRYVIEVDQDFKHSHLYKIQLEEDEEGKRKVQQLSSGEFTVKSYDWAPDGKSIVFAYSTDPKINTRYLNGDIAIIPADSGAMTPLITTAGVESNPKFSPDGQWIAYLSTGDQPELIGLADLYLVSIEGGIPKALAHTPDRNPSLIGWSDDGNSLFVSEPKRTTLVAMQVPINEASEEGPQIITPNKGISTSVVFDTKNNKMAYVYQTMDRPAEVYVAQVNGSGAKSVSNINSDLKLPKMGKTEVITWNSKDGLEIEGILTYPVAYEEGKKYPLVLQIHGGPAGVFLQAFTGNPGIYLNQYFAERGFAVIRPNPRGSTGYGKDFRYANFQDWGFGDYEDVMSGVDKVIQMGIGDEDHMAVMGWSYGGYLTSFLVTRTNRFKAASMGAGLPNLISMTTTTDIPDYLVGHMGIELWEDYERYEKHSAIYQIKQVNTPTQVIHGANDLRVPFTQGQEYYVALQRMGVPSEMLVLPRTPHGPREPKLLMEVSPRILDWFEKYIEVEL